MYLTRREPLGFHFWEALQFKDDRTSVYGLFSLGDSPDLAEAERRTQAKLAEELESYRRLLEIVADHDPLAALEALRQVLGA